MKTKKQYKYFSIFNHEKEQDYLREMHKQGWKLRCRIDFCMVYF